MEAFDQNTYALIEAIEECLEKRRLMPCLVLLYPIYAQHLRG